MDWSLLIALGSLLLSVHTAVSRWRESRLHVKGYLSGFAVEPCALSKSMGVGLVCTLQNLSSRYCEIHSGCLETSTGLRLSLLSHCEMQCSRALPIEGTARLAKAPAALQTEFPISLAPYRARKMMLWVVLDGENELQSELLSVLLSRLPQESSTACRTGSVPSTDGDCAPAGEETQLPCLRLRLACISGTAKVRLDLGGSLELYPL